MRQQELMISCKDGLDEQSTLRSELVKKENLIEELRKEIEVTTYSHIKLYVYNTCSYIAYLYAYYTIIYIIIISLINTPGVLLFPFLKSKCLYLNNATVQYYLRVHYYFYTYKQLYVLSFLFFDNLTIVLRMTLLFTASNDVAR